MTVCGSEDRAHGAHLEDLPEPRQDVRHRWVAQGCLARRAGAAAVAAAPGGRLRLRFSGENGRLGRKSQKMNDLRKEKKVINT